MRPTVDNSTGRRGVTLVALLLVFVLSLMGCNETFDVTSGGGQGGGGAGGMDGLAGNCGFRGQGGGAYLLAPGLWINGPHDPPIGRACYFVSSDCTALMPSAECNLDEDDGTAHFLEVEWSNGRDEAGEPCAAGVGVTMDDVSEVPIQGDGFVIELTDDEGGDWRIEGAFWAFGQLLVRRTEGGGYCSPSDAVPMGWAGP